MPDDRHAFGGKGDVDPIRHLIAIASAWGGSPDKDAIYLNVTTPDNGESRQVALLPQPGIRWREEPRCWLGIPQRYVDHGN